MIYVDRLDPARISEQIDVDGRPGELWSQTAIGRATGLRFGRGLDRWTPGEMLFPSEAINS